MAGGRPMGRIRYGLGMLLLLTAGLLWVAGCGESQNPALEEGPGVAGTPPDFTLRDLQGRKWTLSDQRGRPVLMLFTTTWCPSCRQEVPHYKAIYERYRPLGLEMVNIDIQETKEKVARFADHNALPYPILLDETGEVAQAYGVVGVPFTALLDRDGRVVCLPCRSLDMELSALYPAAP